VSTATWKIWFLLLLAAFPAAAPAAVPADAEPEAALTEPAWPLAAAVSRSEAEWFRVQSAALYAHGRMLLQRQDRAGALRRWQRAWRYHPDAAALLPEIVFLAHNLRWREEAARYALLAAERSDLDPLLLRQLALQLDERAQWRRALRLYEKAWQARQAGAPGQPTTAAGDVLLQMEMGRLYFLTEQHSQAAAMFSRVREALEHPERISQNESLQKLVLGRPDRTYRILAEGFLQAGRCDDAAAMFQKAHETAKDAPQLAFQLARVAAKRGQHEEALRQLDGYFQAKATSAGSEPYALLREELEATSPDPAAARDKLLAKLAPWLVSDPDNRPLVAAAAVAHAQSQRWEEAERLWRRLVTLKSPLAAYDGLVPVYRQHGRTEPLLALLGVCVVTAKSFRPVEQAELRSGPQAKLAAELVAAARRQLADKDHPPGAGPLLAGARIALQEKQYDAAEELAARGLPLLEAEVKPVLTLSWGVDLLIARRYASAVRLLRQALDEQSDPDRQRVLRFYLARALALHGESDEALRTADKLASDSPDSPRFQAQAAWVLYHAKRYEAAERRYREVLQKFEPRHDSSEVRDVLRDVRLVLSIMANHRQRRPEAEEWLEQVLDEFPEDAGALNDLGYLWTEQGKNLNRALVMIQEALREAPENRAYIDSLGWAYYQLGRYAEAVAQLEKAAAGEETDGVILEHLGDAYLKVNQKHRAVASWKQAVEAFRRNQEPDRIGSVVTKIQQHEK
jgi:tetratricopeptide (TPR) repeat protein